MSLPKVGCEYRNTLFVFLITSFALTGCMSRPRSFHQPPEQTTLLADRVELPTTFMNGCPYVDMMINGKGPYRFLVDTGAAGMTITSRVVREARVPVFRNHVAKVRGASGEFEMQRIGRVERVESPLIALRGISASIAGPKTPNSDGRFGDGVSGGILGLSAFQDALLEIDYPQRKVSVVRFGSGTLAADEGVTYAGTCPLVTIATPSAKNATTTALIDTGGEGDFQLADIATYPVRVGLIKADAYCFGVGGFWRPFFGQLAGDIRLGNAIWRDPVIHSANKNRIGSGALAHLRVLIDQQKKMLWLLAEQKMAVSTWTGPLDPDGRPAVYGFASLPDGDSFIVKEVDPGSRAERAGLKIGDVMLPQDEEAVALERTQKKDPYLARMRIVRGDEKLEITMSLSEPLPVTAKSPP